MKIMWGLLCVLFVFGCTESIGNATLPQSKVLEARDDDDFAQRVKLTTCPVGLVSGISLDEEFGPGTSELTRCLTRTDNVSVVYSVAKTCADAECTKPYALHNIENAIADYEVTHGLVHGLGYDINMVVYSAGYQLVLDNNSLEPHIDKNPFQAQIESLIARGVHVYFCQNAARSKKVRTSQLIQGVRWVTAGVTAIADFQYLGYALVVP